MSDWLLEKWSEEDIDCSLVRRTENSVPAMYMINVASGGERSFLYWRKDSPASRMFDNSDVSNAIFEAIIDHQYIYLSGITMAILSETSVARLIDFLKSYRRRGGRVIFDGNYRSILWNSHADAQRAYANLYEISDIALPTFEDEALLFGHESALQVVHAINTMGVSEVVVKMGGEGCLAHFDGEQAYVEAESVTTPVDTTAAGDSFNAAYIAARIHGLSVVEACRAGHSLAAKVIQYHGAIISPDHM